MTELAIPLKVYNVEYICDTCGAGRMRPSENIQVDENSGNIPHVCNNKECKETIVLNQAYPQQRMIEDSEFFKGE